MGLAARQQMLAQLFTDARLREQMLADPERMRSAFDVNAEEAVLLAGEFDRFAISLIHKRRGEVEKLLALSRRAMGKQLFTTLFAKFARQFVPNGVKKHRDDAAAFADFLRQSGAVKAAWIVDLLRYEAAMLAADAPKAHLTIRVFRFAFADLVHAALEQAHSPSRRWSIGIWLRIAPGARLRRFVIAQPRPTGAIPRRAENDPVASLGG